jgi:hypothetical protein
MNWTTQILGFAVAPLAVPLSLVLMNLLNAQRIGLGYESDALEGDLIGFGIDAYFVIGCLVIPLMIVLRRLKWATAFSCVVIGLVAWFILTFLLPPHYDSPIPDPDRLMLAISCSIGGALSGLIFWIVAYWKLDVAHNSHNPIDGIRLK